jgi:hypothetical protein
VWIVWQKKASRPAGDLTIQSIVPMCAAFGLSAYKTCSVDETWSAAAVGRAGGRGAYQPD